MTIAVDWDVMHQTKQTKAGMMVYIRLKIFLSAIPRQGCHFKVKVTDLEFSNQCKSICLSYDKDSEEQCTKTFFILCLVSFLHMIYLNMTKIQTLFVFRQRLINEKESFFSLIEKYLPMEEREKLIPVARAYNRIEPKL